MPKPKTVSPDRKQTLSTKSPAMTPPGRGKRGARRAELRAELTTIFLREGFRDLTIDSLAKRLGCSNRTLYAIAPSKEEMFLTVLSEGLDKYMREGLEGALIQADPVTRIEAYLRPGVIHSRELGSKAFEDIESYLPARQLLERYRAERMRVLEEIIASGIKSGSFRRVHPHLVAETLLAGINRIEQLSIKDNLELTFEKAVEELYDLLLHGLVLP